MENLNFMRNFKNFEKKCKCAHIKNIFYVSMLLFISLLSFSLITVSDYAIAQDEAPAKKVKPKKSKAKTAKPKEAAESKKSQNSVKTADKKTVKSQASEAKVKDNASEKASPQQKTAEINLASKEFTFYQNGGPFAKENFERKIIGGLMNVTAEIIISVSSRIKIRQNYSLDARTMILKKYLMEISGGGDIFSTSVDYVKNSYQMRSMRNGKISNVKDIKKPALYILDNNNANNFQCLLDAYSQKKAGVQKFDCVIPQAFITCEVALLKIGFVKGNLNKVPSEFLKYKITNSINGMEIFAYVKNDGGLACVQIPAQKIEFSIDGVAIQGDERSESSTLFDIGGVKFSQNDIYFKSKDNKTLYGKTLVPAVDKGVKMPAVLLVAGSGPTDCDGNSTLIPGKIDLLKDIAFRLAQENVVTLRYDKRGVGRSEMTANPAFGDFINDAECAFEKIESLPQTDTQSVYVIGHSEGALIASALASKKNVKGVVLLAPPADTPEALIFEQLNALGAREKIPAQELKNIQSAMNVLFNDIKSGKPAAVKKSGIPSVDMLFQSFAANANFMKEFLVFDPITEAQKIKSRVFIAAAENDAQVPAVSVLKISEALKKAGNDRVSYINIKKANHVFKPCADKNDFSSYTSKTQNTSDELLTALTDFIKYKKNSIKK